MEKLIPIQIVFVFLVITFIYLLQSVNACKCNSENLSTNSGFRKPGSGNNPGYYCGGQTDKRNNEYVLLGPCLRGHLYRCDAKGSDAILIQRCPPRCCIYLDGHGDAKCGKEFFGYCYDAK